MRFTLAIASLFALGNTDLAPQQPAPQTDSPTYLRCGSLWDGVEDRLQTRHTITVVGSQIDAVDASVSVPARPTGVVNLNALTCLPGLIDVHTHVLLQGNITAESDQRTTQRVVAGVANARQALEYGFTTIRDMNSVGVDYADVDIAQAIARRLIPGPRMQVATIAFNAVDLPNFAVCATPDDCRRLVRRAVGNGADWIKVFADRGVRLQADATFDDVPTFSVQALVAIVEEAHALGTRVAAHASGRTSVHNAVAAGVDSIEHGMYIAPEDIVTMARRRIWYVPTPYQILRPALASREAADRMKRGIDVIADTFRRALRGGVPIAFGSDIGGFPWSTSPAVQLPMMVDYGMKPVEALRSATSGAAEMLRLGHQVGSIEVGKVADIVAVRGNPIVDITALQRVEFVMREGHIVKLTP